MGVRRKGKLTGGARLSVALGGNGCAGVAGPVLGGGEAGRGGLAGVRVRAWGLGHGTASGRAEQAGRAGRGS